VGSCGVVFGEAERSGEFMPSVCLLQVYGRTLSISRNAGVREAPPTRTTSLTSVGLMSACMSQVARYVSWVCMREKHLNDIPRHVKAE